MKALRGLYYAFVLSIPFETVLYFRTEEDGASGVSVSRVLGVLLLGLALVHARKSLRTIPAAFWLVAWYVAAFTLSELWIPPQLTSRFRELQTTLVQSAALLLITANLFEDEEFRARVFRTYGWGIALAAALMLAGVLGIQLDAENRSSFRGANPNSIGCLFAIGALCLAGDERVLGVRRRPGYTAAAAAGVATLVYGIMRTGSRGALFSFCAGMLALCLCGSRANRRARAALAAAAAAAIGLMIQREFANRTAMASRLERSVNEGDTAGRTGIFDAAWTMFLERPLTGYGGANNRFILGTYANYASDRKGEADRDTHNTYLAVVTEVGLLGGGPFIVALLLAAGYGWRRGRRTSDALPFALMCAMLGIGTVGTATRQKLFWIVLAAAIASRPRRARAVAGSTAAPPLIFGREAAHG